MYGFVYNANSHQATSLKHIWVMHIFVCIRPIHVYHHQGNHPTQSCMDRHLQGTKTKCPTYLLWSLAHPQADIYSRTFTSGYLLITATAIGVSDYAYFNNRNCNRPTGCGFYNLPIIRLYINQITGFFFFFNCCNF